MRIFKAITLLILFMSQLTAETTRIDSLTNELNNRKEAEQIEIYNLLAEANWYIAPEKTIQYGQIAYSLAEKYNNEQQKALALINIGNGHMFTGNFMEALEDYLEPGLKLAEKIKYDKGIAGGLNSIAACYMNLGNYRKALDTFKQSLQILEQNNDFEKAARIKMNIASLYTNWGNFDLALDYYFEALQVFEDIGDKDLLSRVLNNVAVAYHSWGNYDKALEFYQRSLQLYDEMNNELGKAIPLNNIGEIYKDKEQYDTALEYYMQCLDLVSSTGNKQSIGVALQGAGEALKGLKNYDLATDYLLRALENFSSIGFQEGIANSYHDLGDIHRLKKDYKTALQYLEKSMELSEGSNIKDLIKQNYYLLSEVYEEIGDFQASLDNFKSYSAINDSIFTDETNNKITEMEIKYSTAKKEQEILILKEQNKSQRVFGIFLITALLLIFVILVIIFFYYRSKEKANKILQTANLKIQKQKEELEELNATKNKFFSIIAHDLKNAFISQKTGSKLLFKDIDQLDTETIRLLASELYNSAENLYKLLQNLLDWSRIQMKGIDLHPEVIDLQEFIQNELKILTNIASRKSIKLIYEIEDNLKVKVDPNMLSSILQSLINNGIKFSYPGSEIRISSNSLNGIAQISIKDHGIGIDRKDIDKLFKVDENFSSVGTANEKGTGLGLILCKEFIELNNGKIEVNSITGHGTVVSFTLPIAN